MKSQKMLSIWGLGCRNYIWATWAKKTYLAITPEPYHQSLHTRPHFIQNQKLLSLKLLNLKKFVNLGSGVYKLHLGHLGPKDVSSHNSWNLTLNFTYKTSFHPESWVVFNIIRKNKNIMWTWGLGPRNYIWITMAHEIYQVISPEP